MSASSSSRASTPTPPARRAPSRPGVPPGFLAAPANVVVVPHATGGFSRVAYTADTFGLDPDDVIEAMTGRRPE